MQERGRDRSSSQVNSSQQQHERREQLQAGKQSMRAENGDANETARRLGLMMVGGRRGRERKGAVAVIETERRANHARQSQERAAEEQPARQQPAASSQQQHTLRFTEPREPTPLECEPMTPPCAHRTIARPVVRRADEEGSNMYITVH